jgi:hypothetical protein
VVVVVVVEEWKRIGNNVALGIKGLSKESSLFSNSLWV